MEQETVETQDQLEDMREISLDEMEQLTFTALGEWTA